MLFKVGDKMILVLVFCALFYTTAMGQQAEMLLEEISSAVIAEMARTLASQDVMKIDAALREATARLRPQLRQAAELLGMTPEAVASQVAHRVSVDQRLILALKNKRLQEGGIAPRSDISIRQFINQLVFNTLMSMK